MLRSWVTPEVRISLFDILLDLLQPIYPILGLQVDLWLLKMVSNDSFITQNMGFDTRAISIACSEADNPKLEFHFLKSSLPPTAHPLCSWPSGQSEASKNGPKWFSITQNMGFDTMLMLACSEAELLPKLEFLFLMSSWTSYRPSTQFLAFRSICGSWKWSEMIPA